MVWKARKAFNWYAIGDPIKEEDLVHKEQYLKDGLAKDYKEEVVEPKEVVPEPKEIVEEEEVKKAPQSRRIGRKKR